MVPDFLTQLMNIYDVAPMRSLGYNDPTVKYGLTPSKKIS
jgi:hypothetical protein